MKLETYTPIEITPCNDLEGNITFNNKLTPEILEAIEQEVINYELAEMINRGELK